MQSGWSPMLTPALPPTLGNKATMPLQASASPLSKEDLAGLGFDGVRGPLVHTQEQSAFLFTWLRSLHILNYKGQNLVLYDSEECHIQKYLPFCPLELWKRLRGGTGTSLGMRPWRQLPASSNLTVL